MNFKETLDKLLVKQTEFKRESIAPLAINNFHVNDSMSRHNFFNVVKYDVPGVVPGAIPGILSE